MADYSKDTGDKLLEFHARRYAESHGVEMPHARAIVDCTPSLQGLLGRSDVPDAYAKACQLVGITP